MKWQWKNVALIVCISVLFLYPVIAEEAASGDSGDEYFSIAKKVSIRIGVGTTIPQSDISFQNWGIYENAIATLSDEKIEDETHLAISVCARYSLWDYLSIGFSIDYSIVSLINFGAEINTAAGPVKVEGDPGRIHCLAIYPFIEFRYPFSYFGPWLPILDSIAPYVQAGVGVNLNILGSDFDDDILYLNNGIMNFAGILGGGIEIFPKKANWSFFAEAKYHFNPDHDVTFEPTEASRFKGDLTLDNLSFHFGVTMYF